MTQPREGIDHSLYCHSPGAARPAWQWPGHARLAFCIFLYFEYWELDPPTTALHDPRFDGPLGDLFPNYRAYTQFEYANRIGIFRILALLDRYHLTATLAANAGACTRYPFLVSEFKRRGYEFAAHGSFATRMMSSRMGEAEQRAEIAHSAATIEAMTGRRPRGWVSQDFGESSITPHVLAQERFAYVADWGNDDQPYFMRTDPPLLSIPNQAEWDDVQLIWHRRVAAPVYRDTVCEAFDQLHREGETSGMFFGLHIHPWLLGMPHRIGCLEEVMTTIMAIGDVWHTTAGGVTDYVLERGRSRA
jgi:peptidoglycan/xylan/chitin deacetylase (PgdA/CDA1 family)